MEKYKTRPQYDHKFGSVFSTEEEEYYRATSLTPPPLTDNLAMVHKSAKMKPIFYFLLQIGRMLSNGKDTLPPLSKWGVYLLRCKDCPAVYVGECERRFRVRIDDHAKAFFNNDPTRSALAKYLLEEDHSPADEEILHLETKFSRRICLENIEIRRFPLHPATFVLNTFFHKDPLV